MLGSGLHEKSMGKSNSMMALLSRILSAIVVDLDAGCCGMAGSFGYERAHDAVFQAIANWRLIPTVKSVGGRDVVVAPGTSCRQQLAEFANAKAVHSAIFASEPIEVIRSGVE
jgi:Fe-S oxidoreductase